MKALIGIARDQGVARGTFTLPHDKPRAWLLHPRWPSQSTFAATDLHIYNIAEVSQHCMQDNHITYPGALLELVGETPTRTPSSCPRFLAPDRLTSARDGCR